MRKNDKPRYKTRWRIDGHHAGTERLRGYVMYLRFAILLFALITLVTSTPLRAGDKQVFFRDDFESLDKWKPFFFPKINRHSTYSIHTDLDNSVLKTESSSSASALVTKEVFDVYSFPLVRWRWKVETVYQSGDARIKSGEHSVSYLDRQVPRKSRLVGGDESAQSKIFNIRDAPRCLPGEMRSLCNQGARGASLY